MYCEIKSNPKQVYRRKSDSLDVGKDEKKADLIFLCIMGRSKIVPVHDTKANSGSGGIVPFILNLGSGWT
jgi:hypothetical protein